MPVSLARSAVLAAAAVLLGSAGACRQDWEGPLPPPDELGAAPLPEGAQRGGVDATYAMLMSDGGEGGTSCYSLVQLRDDGSAATTGICTEEPIADVAASPEAWELDPELGDYAWRDGMLWTRIVWWDSLAEELVLSERVRRYCGTRLVSDGERPEYRLDPLAADLVLGDPPPDATACP